MTNENQNLEIKEEKCNCICHSKAFRKFLISALGTFVGVFCALSLFCALHKPPMFVPTPPCHCGCMRPVMHQFHHADRMRGPRADFHKKNLPNNLERKIPVKVEIED